MIVNGNHFRTIWPDQYCQYVEIINQTKLPFAFEVVRISNLSEMVQAIKTMQVRGAPLIGVAAAYGLALALIKNANNQSLELAIDMLVNSRPTAVNLSWALQRMKSLLLPLPESQRLEVAW
jgi:methylthioribose-1-phosphate isomerase